MASSNLSSNEEVKSTGAEKLERLYKNYHIDPNGQGLSKNIYIDQLMKILSNKPSDMGAGTAERIVIFKTIIASVLYQGQTEFLQVMNNQEKYQEHYEIIRNAFSMANLLKKQINPSQESILENAKGLYLGPDRTENNQIKSIKLFAKAYMDVIHEHERAVKKVEWTFDLLKEDAIAQIKASDLSDTDKQEKINKFNMRIKIMKEAINDAPVERIQSFFESICNSIEFIYKRPIEQKIAKIIITKNGNQKKKAGSNETMQSLQEELQKKFKKVKENPTTNEIIEAKEKKLDRKNLKRIFSERVLIELC
jgi:hypothetical protein